jgi:probable F420-dependent oxidoreductase
MRLGVFGLNSTTTFGPDATAHLARHCERLGYDSVWAGEHVVLPSPRVPPAPMNPEDPILDPLIHLAFVAAATERVLLGTGIIILPQRHPLVLAKQIASLDVLSGGRFLFGVGVGYLEPELGAMGVTLAERASRTDDHLDAMAAIWYDAAPVAFDGPHTSFSGLDANPRPTRRIPIVVGGRTPGAYRRAATRGDEWYGFFLSPDQAAECIAALRHAAATNERPARLGELVVSITPTGPVTPDSLAAYRAAGVDRLIVYPAAARSPEQAEAWLTQQAEVVLG